MWSAVPTARRNNSPVNLHLELIEEIVQGNELFKEIPDTDCQLRGEEVLAGLFRYGAVDGTPPGKEPFQLLFIRGLGALIAIGGDGYAGGLFRFLDEP